MVALSLIRPPSFFQVIFTAASLTLQVSKSSSSAASVDCEFRLIRAAGFSVLRKRQLTIWSKTASLVIFE